MISCRFRVGCNFLSLIQNEQNLTLVPLKKKQIGLIEASILLTQTVHLIKELGKCQWRLKKSVICLNFSLPCHLIRQIKLANFACILVGNDWEEQFNVAKFISLYCLGIYVSVGGEFPRKQVWHKNFFSIFFSFQNPLNFAQAQLQASHGVHTFLHFLYSL